MRTFDPETSTHRVLNNWHNLQNYTDPQATLQEHKRLNIKTHTRPITISTTHMTHNCIKNIQDSHHINGPIELFLVPASLHNWCNKGCGKCYPVCGMMHIKEPLLLIGKSSPCGGSGFPLLLSEWFFTLCMMPYNRK